MSRRARAASAALVFGVLLPALEAQTSQTTSWTMVTSNGAPLLRKIENKPDSLLWVMPAGLLVERKPLPVAGTSRDVPVTTLAFDQTFETEGRIQFTGAIGAISINQSSSAYTFASALKQAAKLPPRNLLCKAADHASGYPAGTCAGQGRLIAVPAAPAASRFIVVDLEFQPEQGRFIVLPVDEQSVRAGSVRANADTGSADVLAQMVLPGGGDHLLLTRQYVRDGARTGWQWTFLVLRKDGTLHDGLRVPMKIALPANDTVHQRFGTVRLVPGPDGRIATVDGEDRTQVISSGAVTNSRKYSEEIHWDQEARRFVSRRAPQQAKGP
jgi:hypothetical protein